jgi:hypothetical protein
MVAYCRTSSRNVGSPFIPQSKQFYMMFFHEKIGQIYLASIYFTKLEYDICAKIYGSYENHDYHNIINT